MYRSLPGKGNGTQGSSLQVQEKAWTKKGSVECSCPGGESWWLGWARRQRRAGHVAMATPTVCIQHLPGLVRICACISCYIIGLSSLLDRAGAANCQQRINRKTVIFRGKSCFEHRPDWPDVCRRMQVRGKSHPQLLGPICFTSALHTGAGRDSWSIHIQL